MDYYIAPSSVHEMIIIPDWLIDSYQEVKELVKNTNDSIIQPNDRLTDNVYHYDIADHIFESGDHLIKGNLLAMITWCSQHRALCNTGLFSVRYF